MRNYNYVVTIPHLGQTFDYTNLGDLVRDLRDLGLRVDNSVFKDIKKAQSAPLGHKTKQYLTPINSEGKKRRIIIEWFST